MKGLFTMIQILSLKHPHFISKNMSTIEPPYRVCFSCGKLAIEQDNCPCLNCRQNAVQMQGMQQGSQVPSFAKTG